LSDLTVEEEADGPFRRLKVTYQGKSIRVAHLQGYERFLEQLRVAGKPCNRLDA